jgi:glycine cleavage system H protein
VSEYLETTYDKFTFRVKTGYRYSRDDVWVRLENGLATVGLTDFSQRRSGDVAFVELPAAGQKVAAGEPCGLIETIKVAQEILSPLSGTVVAVNQELEMWPERVNEEPYGRGWLFQLKPAGPSAFEEELLDDQTYFEWMLGRLEEEGRKSGH